MNISGLENEIQSWIAVQSEHSCQFAGDVFVVCAEDLAEFIKNLFENENEKLEGCVVVPVQCPDPDFADSLFDELSKKAIGEFGDDLLIHFSNIDEEKIWALMVEQAMKEPTND